MASVQQDPALIAEYLEKVFFFSLDKHYSNPSPKTSKQNDSSSPLSFFSRQIPKSWLNFKKKIQTKQQAHMCAEINNDLVYEKIDEIFISSKTCSTTQEAKKWRDLANVWMRAGEERRDGRT